METVVYTKEGKKSRDIALPARVFGAKKNADLVHQVVVSQTSSAREPIAHTKTRGDVRGGGKKPWQQKGTGRARHGSTRSPIWVGGGVSHGPRNDKNYLRKINRKMKSAALASVLSQKVKANEIIFVEDFALAGKTKDGMAVMRALSKGASAEALTKKVKNAAYVLFSVKNPMTERALRNIGNISVGEVRNLDVVSALSCKYIVMVNPEKSFEILLSKFGGEKVSEGEKAEISAEAKPKSAKRVVKKAPSKKTKAKTK
ncbi:MAG: 50S ribosomal protein L4 [Minisyncoccia bacterium]